MHLLVCLKKTKKHGEFIYCSLCKIASLYYKSFVYVWKMLYFNIFVAWWIKREGPLSVRRLNALLSNLSEENLPHFKLQLSILIFQNTLLTVLQLAIATAVGYLPCSLRHQLMNNFRKTQTRKQPSLPIWDMKLH